MHPEYYMHSWSNKVRKNRKLFATAMEEYSKMDIVIKQAYQEGIFLHPPLPLPLIIRWIINRIRQQMKNRGNMQSRTLPSYLPSSYVLPTLTPPPNPYISPEGWPYGDYRPWPNSSATRGHEQYIRDKYGQAGQRRPDRSPLPSDIPQPGDRDDNRNPAKIPPTVIVVEVDTDDPLYKLYEIKVWAESEYGKVVRWIKAHKKEVIIIVLLGAIITLGWSLIAGGAELSAGELVLANPEANVLYPGLALLPPSLPIQWIDHYFYKEIIIRLSKPLNLWAWNYSRMWKCYREVTYADNVVYYQFYQGPTAEAKGELAAFVEVTFHLDDGTVEISPVCGPCKDEVAVWMGNEQILLCNKKPTRYPYLWAYNYTENIPCEPRITQSGNLITYAFEDRPIFGDGDYNDAYGYIKTDGAGNVIAVWAEEGEHDDEIGVFYGLRQIGYYPAK